MKTITSQKVLRSQIACFIILGVVAPLQICFGQQKDKAEQFSIIIDPKLGKPLIALRQLPRDKNGRTAIDFLDLFFRHVRDEKINEAKKMCCFSVSGLLDAGSIGSVTRHDLPKDPIYATPLLANLDASEALFPQFLKRIQSAKRITLGAAVKQKGDYWTVRVRSEGSEISVWPESTYLSFSDGEWRIQIHDLTYTLRDEQ